MNPYLTKLQPYPFERLNQLKAKANIATDKEHIALSIGEPQHPTPSFIIDTLTTHLHLMGKYPATAGLPELRQAIASWLERRFKLGNGSVNPNGQVIPVNGTREALFAFTQFLLGENGNVLSPNPFYQIYEGATFLAGGQIEFLNCMPGSSFMPDFDAVDDATWESCDLLFLCSPHNPTGAVIQKPMLQKLISLAEKHDFVIVSDECYSEIYTDEANPPCGLLEAAKEMGNDQFKRCVVMHSLSKRSNAPGLRSGFVAGDEALLSAFLKYRTYHGCAMSLPIQHASIAAWNDEQHVLSNRDEYRAKFKAVLKTLSPVMNVAQTDASFYLWPETPIDDQAFALGLFEQQHVTVLPGSFLSRERDGVNPGKNRVRMALVAELDECIDAANRIKTFIETL